MSDKEDDLAMSFDSEETLSPVEGENHLPEISRLYSFIKDLEDELGTSDQDMFRNLSVDISTAPDSDEESVHSIHADDVTSPIGIDLSSYDELYKGFTPSSSSARTPYSLIKKKSNLDVFLDALVESGYANLETSLEHAPKGGTGLTELVNDHFFKSAHHDHSNSPVQRNLTSDMRESDNLKRTGSMRVIEGFTRESLRANWDLEEEATTTPQSSLKVAITPTSRGVGNSGVERHVASFPDLDSSVAADEYETVAASSPQQQQIQTANTAGNSPAKNNSPTTSSKAGVDPRVHGDFNVWSGGFMLSSEYIQQEYVGLHPTVLTHYLDDGKLVQSAAVTASMSPIAVTNIGSTFALPSTDTNTRGYYNLHVMECVLRPDVEVKVIMSIVVKLAKERSFKCSLLQTNHAVITLKHNHNMTLQTTTAHPIPSRAGREWDQIDVQICISRELRQRVLLLQFLKRISLFDGLSNLNLSGMIMNQLLPGPQAILPLTQCPMTKEFATKLKKQLITQQLTLSTLYHIPITQVCALPKGMDTHFLAQLHSLVRDNMWMKLTAEFASMDKHVKEQEEHVMVFMKMMEAVYKHYNMRIADLVSTHNSPSSSSCSGGLAELLDNSNNTVAVNKEKNKESSASKQQPAAADQGKGDKRVEMTSSSSSTLTAAATTVAVTEADNNSAVTTPAKQAVNKDTSFSFDGLSPAGGAVKSNHSIIELSPSYERSLLSKQQPPLHTSTGGKVDGMVFCLIMLDKCYQELQSRCDVEYADKMQRRHENTLLAVQDLVSHKRAVLTALVHNASEARQSSLMKTFIGNFSGITLTRFDHHQSLDTDAAADDHDESAAPKQRRSYTIASPDDTTDSSNSSSSSGSEVKLRRHSVDEIEPAQAPAPAPAVASSSGGFFSMFSSSSSASTSSSSLAPSSSVTEPAAAPATTTMTAGLFKSKENRKVMTPEQVHQRVRELNAIAEWTSSSTSIASAEDEMIAKQRKSERHAERWRFVFDLPRAIVLYYFACIVNNQQGTVYITQYYVCIASSLLGFNAKKEVYLLSDLTDIVQQQQQNNTTTAEFVPKSMTLVFCQGEKEVVVSPLVVDCIRAKMMFMEIQSQFFV